jgi:hypothetical protein
MGERLAIVDWLSDLEEYFLGESFAKSYSLVHEH